MRWRNLGRIFDPLDHQLPAGCREFAQSPQALVCDGFLRIFFSTRARDSTGKYLSHPCFVDFAPGFREILRVSRQPVMPLGDLGCFDEHGIFPISVLRDGGRVLAYTTGWNRKVAVSADASIGLAVSTDDGATFTRIGPGPVLTASLHEPYLVCDGFVQRFNGRYHMWYIYGVRWLADTPEQEPQRVYKIAQADSSDGITWRRDGRQVISDRLNRDECQALPTVARIGDRYHMVFCYREATDFRTVRGRGYRLGQAVSTDLLRWTRNDDLIPLEPGADGWDADMQCYPCIFHWDGQTYLLYNGNEFGRRGFGAAVLDPG